MEGPLWFAPPGVEPVEDPTYRRSNAFAHVRAECHAVRTGVGIYETSNYGKYEITGKGARAWLDRVFACRIPRPGRMAIAPMLNARGRVMGDLSIACIAEDRYLIVGSGFAEAFHMRWFWQSNPPDDVFVRSACSTLTGFALSGPKARTLLERLADFDVSNEAFKFFAVREGAVGMSPAIVQRCGFTGELGYEIWVTPDFQLQLYEDILAAGEDLGLAHYGGRAISSLRLEKNYGSFNKDFRPDYTPAETGLDAFVDFTKNVDFTGRAAVLAEKERGPAKRFVVFAVDAPHADVVGYEVVLKDGEPVGHVTSGGYGHWVGTEPRRGLRAGVAGRGRRRLRHRHPRPGMPRRHHGTSAARPRWRKAAVMSGPLDNLPPDNLPPEAASPENTAPTRQAGPHPPAALDRPVQRRAAPTDEPLGAARHLHARAARAHPRRRVPRAGGSGPGDPQRRARAPSSPATARSWTTRRRWCASAATSSKAASTARPSIRAPRPQPARATCMSAATS